MNHVLLSSTTVFHNPPALPSPLGSAAGWGASGCRKASPRCPEDMPVSSLPAAAGNLPYCKQSGVAVYLSPLFHHSWLGAS